MELRDPNGLLPTWGKEGEGGSFYASRGVWRGFLYRG
jgi:hypothetical protein